MGSRREHYLEAERILDSCDAVLRAHPDGYGDTVSRGLEDAVRIAQVHATLSMTEYGVSPHG